MHLEQVLCRSRVPVVLRALVNAAGTAPSRPLESFAGVNLDNVLVRSGRRTVPHRPSNGLARIGDIKAGRPPGPPTTRSADDRNNGSTAHSFAANNSF